MLYNGKFCVWGNITTFVIGYDKFWMHSILVKLLLYGDNFSIFMMVV